MKDVTIMKGTKRGMSQLWQERAITPVTEIAVTGGAEALHAVKEGTRIAVRGTSKGRGFQGVVKRHGFLGLPKSHGTTHSHRAPGSIGATAPQRVIPGRKMAGRMGSARITLKNLLVVSVDAAEGRLFVKGAVPGSKGSAVELLIRP